MLGQILPDSTVSMEASFTSFHGPKCTESVGREYKVLLDHGR